VSLFSKTPKGDDARRLPDEPLGGQWAKSLPLVHRIVIHVLVSEIRQMLDERDAEREAKDQWLRQRAADRWAREQFADTATAAPRDEPEGSGIAGR